MQSKRRVPVLCVSLFCGMFKASSGSKQQVQEYRERAPARDCQQLRLLLGKRLLLYLPVFYPYCRTPSEGCGCSPVSRCQPEPTQSRSGPFRRPGLPGESAGLKRNGNMQSIFLHCSRVGVAVVQFFFVCAWLTTERPACCMTGWICKLDMQAGKPLGRGRKNLSQHPETWTEVVSCKRTWCEHYGSQTKHGRKCRFGRGRQLDTKSLKRGRFGIRVWQLAHNLTAAGLAHEEKQAT